MRHYGLTDRDPPEPYVSQVVPHPSVSGLAAQPDGADLGHADQARPVRVFTATVGVPPTAYAEAVAPRPPRRHAPA